MSLITAKDVMGNEKVKIFLTILKKQLDIQGYTEHSFRHVALVSENAGNILENLGYDIREIELAKIAGILHDIGNIVNRTDHAHTGALMAYDILIQMGMEISEISEIMSAIGHHDENTGNAVSNISAALILADKSDVHRSRVSNTDFATFDIHDRVNYAVQSSKVSVDSIKRTAMLELVIDTNICPVMDYFEIFLIRMTMCRRAAKFLNLDFELVINQNRLL